MRFVRFALVITVSALAVACGGSGDSPSTSPSPASPPATNAPSISSAVAIPAGAESLGNRAYMPDDLSVTAGTTVTWMNTDRTSHTSTSDESGWNSGTIAPGGRFSFTFQRAGTYKYHCTIHPGMVGTVVVQ
jgi:plastocyanin